jgi:hypothetical protein
MALLVDKKTSKKLETRLSEFSEYGMTLYYLLEEGRTNIHDLESVLFSKDDEKSSFIYGNIMKHIKPNDLKLSFEKYSINFPQNDIDDNDYKKDLNIIYTKKIIDKVIEESRASIDKTYANTYAYLLTNISK